ncbi:MAG: LacI family DNA-binding transcriptional regulator [Chloroflexota bacterium]|jgi:LacI family transcriptional regulator
MSELTLEDIAKKAGVSRSTVSRVVNNHPNVRETVRNRVMQVIQEAGFHPNAAARALASQRSWVIGLVLPRTVGAIFVDPYFPRLTQGVAQACNLYNYTLALFLVASPADEAKIYPRISRKGSLDGVIVQSGQIGDQLIERLSNAGMPLVVAGRPFYEGSVSYIDVDNVQSTFEAVNHLISIGRRQIATISGPSNSTVGIDRLQGYLNALKAAGLPVNQDLIVAGDFTERGGYQAMQQLLPRKPDAVFAASDAMAVGGMRAVKEAGLSIPRDIAFVGYDNIPLINQPEPPLTTVSQPVTQFGFETVVMLIDLIENGIMPPRRMMMETELVVRESTLGK